jgi:hypothetical protein
MTGPASRAAARTPIALTVKVAHIAAVKAWRRGPGRYRRGRGQRWKGTDEGGGGPGRREAIVVQVSFTADDLARTRFSAVPAPLVETGLALAKLRRAGVTRGRARASPWRHGARYAAERRLVRVMENSWMRYRRVASY